MKAETKEKSLIAVAGTSIGKWLVAIVLLLVAGVAHPQPRSPLEYIDNSVSATQANTAVSFGFYAADVIVVNTDATNEIFVTFASDTAVADTGGILVAPGAVLEKHFPNGQTRPFSIGIICDTGETATVRVAAWSD